MSRLRTPNLQVRTPHRTPTFLTYTARIERQRGMASHMERPEWLGMTPVKPSNEIFNCLIAVSHARNHDELLYSSVAGFIYIQNVHVDVRSPSPLSLLHVKLRF